MSKHRPPLFTNRRTSPGHSKVPVAQATAGKLYRVRDKNLGNGTAPKIWGENLSWNDAVKLKNQIAAKRLSKTVRVEDMAIDQAIRQTPNESPDVDGELLADAGIGDVEQPFDDRLLLSKHGTFIGAVGDEPTDDDIDAELEATK